MNHRSRRLVLAAVAWLAILATSAMAQAPAPSPQAPAPAAAPAASVPDLTTQPTLYVVPYAHLDTQWRWDYPTVITEYLSRTMRDNFRLFEKYPHYVFNFSGANRYRMMKEYYPADYEKLKKYVAAGRWFPSGSSMEENDVNAPSAESVIRQVLYGKEYFRRDFGKTSAEYMLPDCFGFPASLPSILAHAGLKGFSTQKLTWGSFAPVGGPDSPEKTPRGVPFNVGLWEGLDGKTIIAALNAGDYNGNINYDWTKSPVIKDPNARNNPIDFVKRVQLDGQVSGLFADYQYFGTGDIGGSPREYSVKMLESLVTKATTLVPPPQSIRPNAVNPPTPAPQQVGTGPLTIVPATADQMFRDIKPEQATKLPRYKGDLELREHSAGSITSQAYMKRWNRQNEVLADAAERAAIAADWMGGRAYPLARLNDAWTLVMGGQFHDILPGTSIPKAYEYSWNDENVALNQFAEVLTSATKAVGGGLDTQTTGTPVVVYNPLNIAREDIVEARVPFAGGTPAGVRVIGPDAKEVPAQLSQDGRVIFLAKLPSVGYAVYDVQAGSAAAPAAKKAAPAKKGAASAALSVTESSLENGRYRIKIDQNGDIASLFDKSLNRELLSAPMRLAFKTDKPVQWPAWNMDWADQQKPPKGYVQGPATVKIVENGPARVALEISRQAEGSTFVQTIRLAAGDAGNRVELANAIDWKASEVNLKATFPLVASNPMATYNWDIGTIERPTDEPNKYEVPSHQWIDLTDKGGAFGVTVLSDAKYGSDKPDENTIRLTLLRTPGISKGWEEYDDQATQDWGHHEFVYGVAAHAGDWRQGQTDWQALRLNTPLAAFTSGKHAGTIGKRFSLMSIGNPRVRALAVKKAEQGDEIVVRLVELDGKPAAGVRVAFASPLAGAREVNGAEEPVGAATVTKGELVADFTPYQVRSFAVKLGAAPARLAAPASEAVALQYDEMVTSHDGSVSEGRMDPEGHSYSAELFPSQVVFDGVTMKLAGGAAANGMTARGQSIALPAGKYNRVYVLAAADGDQKAAFKVGESATNVTIQNWTGFMGQWDTRLWTTTEQPAPPKAGATPLGAGVMPPMETTAKYAGLVPGYVKPAPIAWFASHRHTFDGRNEPYAYSYVFGYVFDIPAGATTLTLPDNEKIKIFAVSVVDEASGVRPAAPLYDNLEKGSGLR